MGRPNYPPIPACLQQVDELIWIQDEHHYLQRDDQCFYLWERTTGGRYDQYPTNQLIKNFQIAMEVQYTDPRHWYWKGNAITYAARALSDTMPSEWIRDYVFVPVPPSLVKSEAGYDPRLLSTLRRISPAAPDIREIVAQKHNATSKEKQISPEERASNYRIDESCCTPTPDGIVIFDDVLSGGSHFKAMRLVLSARFPGVPILGLFLARSIRPDLCSELLDLAIG